MAVDESSSGAASARSVARELAAARLIAVVTLDEADHAGPLARSLIAGGLTCVEVTLRTPAAERAIEVMAAYDGMLLGAGTVLTGDQVDRAVAAGARFIVSPGLDPAVVRRCRELDVCVVPGVATPTEIQAAVREELTLLKFFPADVLGGVSALDAMSAPFPFVRFIPTGGISAETMGEYLNHPAVTAVGGSWMVQRSLLAAGDFAQVTRLATDAVARLARPGARTARVDARTHRSHSGGST